MKQIHVTVGRLAFICVTAMLVAAPGAASAQAAGDRAAILATIQKTFDAMRTRDTTLLANVFLTPHPLVAAIARATGEPWNERMFDPEVRIDGNIAQVWTYYTFHRGRTFSHCGIDAFTLRKVDSIWKIAFIADTRRTTGCTHTEFP